MKESEVRLPSVPAHRRQRQNMSPGPLVPVLHPFCYTKLPPLVYPPLLLLRGRLEGFTEMLTFELDLGGPDKAFGQVFFSCGLKVKLHFPAFPAARRACKTGQWDVG